MQASELWIDGEMWDDVHRHLLVSSNGEFEEAVFLFCEPLVKDGLVKLTVNDSWMLSPEEFASRSKFYLELTDETRRTIIKRAHNANHSIVEVHSHPGQFDARFSPSDLSGFEEFVPHIRWRLAGRPYAAIVCGQTTFDSLVWTDSNKAGGWCTLVVDGIHRREPTKSSFESMERCKEDGVE